MRKAPARRGAEPNAAWEHPYWPGSALRSLYGATGVNNNSSLARLLLERGADVNDGESIYHAAQCDHRECMDVLAEFGVSLGDTRTGETRLFIFYWAHLADTVTGSRQREVSAGCSTTAPIRTFPAERITRQLFILLFARSMTRGFCARFLKPELIPIEPTRTGCCR